MTALRVPEAARVLDVPPGRLRRWIRQGCPTVRRGRRGRGHAELVDPDAVRQWRGAGERERFILELAGAVHELLADATVEAWRQADGLDKRRLAGVLAGTWYVCTTAVLDHLRDRCANVPELDSIPDEIERLRKINKNV